MRKLWLTLCLIASPVLAMEKAEGIGKDSPLMVNARMLQKEVTAYINATENLLSESNIGEQLVKGAEITDVAIEAVEDIGEIIQKMNALTVRANNDMLSYTDRMSISEAFISARDDIQRILSKTKYEDHRLFDAALDYTYSIIHPHTRELIYQLQIHGLSTCLAPLHGIDLVTTPNAANAVQNMENVVNNLALEIQKLSNIKASLIALLIDNSRQYKRAQSKYDQQIAIMKDYLDTALKLSPPQESSRE